VGMGVSTGFTQLIADELDVPFKSVRMMLGDTATAPSNGGVGGSTTTFQGNFPIRHVAAQMRHMLVEAAAQRFGVPASQLSVKAGVVSVNGDPSRHVQY